MLRKRRFIKLYESGDFSEEYPAIDAFQDLLSIAEAYDQLNDDLSAWFDKYKISNYLYASAEDVLKREYGEVPLMFRITRSVDEELSNESSLRENFDEIIARFNGILRKIR